MRKFIVFVLALLLIIELDYAFHGLRQGEKTSLAGDGVLNEAENHYGAVATNSNAETTNLNSLVGNYNILKGVVGFSENENILYYSLSEENDKALNYFKDAKITTVKNGNKFFVSVSNNEFEKAIKNGAVPESHTVKIEIKNNSLNTVLNNLKLRYNYKVVEKENVQNVLIIYAKSPKLKNNIQLNNNNVNLSIAINDNYIVLGYPLILHSF